MPLLNFKSLQQHIAEEIERDPHFADLLEAARLEVQFAIGLARIREKRGLTQQALAEAAGLRQPMLARYERGQIPTVPTLQRLAGALDAEVRVSPGAVTFVANRRPRKPAAPAVPR